MREPRLGGQVCAPGAKLNLGTESPATLSSPAWLAARSCKVGGGSGEVPPRPPRGCGAESCPPQPLGGQVTMR